ncbi:IS200/IS605 family transposase [Sporolactobacillus inulinus]|uniref:Mobile element protein n=2 Tax=Sporolactobacillus inulinus TaxID=2078 RepID=A0A4Y3T7N8_9BACL|nr:IS200/IS605 family transposase [Sporolactobacillus inulinus]KLI01598.1 transposase [Sporolactobacillus inulinus CASD]GAY76094.1 mobile element protein [Sporolactobacillus inulinus]GEB77055.1 IS200/IS605 family transposase [Sporolactobacillus inulinus]
MLIYGRTNVYDFNFHLVWPTKYRREIFTTNERHDEMKNILLSIAENKGISVEHIEIMPDHVHMMISFPPKMAPASVVKSLKGVSARIWFKNHHETKDKLWGGYLWTPSFFMSTIDNVSKKIVAEYIENQMQKSAKKK